MKKLFIGKLAFSTTESSLHNLFSAYEPVRSLKIINDRETGQSRGFAFVEIDDTQMATQAIETLNGALLDGQHIVVSEARPQSDGPRGGSFGGGRSERSEYGSRGGNSYRASGNSRY